MMLVAGVDVGGTNIEVGLVDDEHRVRERAKHGTPTDSPHKIASTIVKMIEGLDDAPSAIGIGIPGVVHNGRVLEAPNLAGWDASFDIVSELEDHFRVPIALGNDANVGLLGEWLAGAAAGVDDVLGVWMVDTAVEVVAVGIGSAINLIDVQLVVIGGGMAEKLGQELVDRIERAARPWILHPGPKLKFVVASLGDDSGIVGAAAIGRARLLDV